MDSEEILSKEAWPYSGIEKYTCIEDGDWGYLVHYRTKGLVFEPDERPTDEEILERWGSYFSASADAV